MDDLINKKVENFTIISLLGKGGMGVVYKAHDEKLNRFVAIKVLNAPHVRDSKKMIERFKVEAQNHAQLIHQNIVTVYGFIEFENMLGIVMEYVDGESLEKVIFKNRHLHVFDVIYITTQLLDGIGYAHSKGYIHRDIKPSNIIVNSEGVVKIMDFGISKSIEGDNGNTRSGARIGTIHYMSPEQIKGRNVNRTSDIYSIGCTMYDMLLGQPPFDSKNDYEIMDGHLHKVPRSLTQLKPSIPAGLDEIVQKLLKKEQSERYQSCEEVKLDLQQFDKYLKTAEANYFNEKLIRRKLSKTKSILASITFIVLFIALVIFVFYQVKDFMVFKGYKVFQENSISTLFETDEKFTFSDVKKVKLPTSYTLNAIAVKDGFYTVIGDSGIVLTKEDTSENWSKIKLEEGIKLTDIWNFDRTNGIIIGNQSSFIYRENGMLRWYSVLNKSYNLYDILFLDYQTGFIIGSNGLLLRTIDSGKRWEQVNLNTANRLYEIRFINKEVGFIVGAKGTILKTEDSGYSWKKEKSSSGKYLKSIDFYDENIGIAVGGNGTILTTDDGGENWVKISSVTTRRLNKVRFLSEKNIIIIGNNGTVLHSSDSGESWKSVETNLYNNWNDIYLSKDGSIVLVGSNGTLLELKKGVE